MVYIILEFRLQNHFYLFLSFFFIIKRLRVLKGAVHKTYPQTEHNLLTIRTDSYRFGMT